MGSFDPPGTERSRSDALVAAVPPELGRVVIEMPALALLTDGDRVAAVSKRLAGLLGRAPSELLGHGWTRLVHPEDMHRSLGVATAVGMPDSVVLQQPHRNRYLAADGSWVWLSWEWNSPSEGWPWVISIATRVHVGKLAAAEQAVGRWRSRTAAGAGAAGTGIGVVLDQVLRAIGVL